MDAKKIERIVVKHTYEKDGSIIVNITQVAAEINVQFEKACKEKLSYYQNALSSIKYHVTDCENMEKARQQVNNPPKTNKPTIHASGNNRMDLDLECGEMCI